MTTSTSSLTREELEEAIDRMRTVTGAVAVLFQTFISTFGPVWEQVQGEVNRLAQTYPWLLELPPDAEAELAKIEDEFDLPKPMVAPQPAPGTTWRDICVDCGLTQEQHPNSTCDAFACETASPERGQR